MTCPSEPCPTLGEGIDRQLLTELRGRFLAVTQGRLARAMEGLAMSQPTLLELLEEINAAGTTIVMVTHDPELAARAQRNVHIVDGIATDLRHESPLHRTAHATSPTGA